MRSHKLVLTKIALEFCITRCVPGEIKMGRFVITRDKAMRYSICLIRAACAQLRTSAHFYKNDILPLGSRSIR